MAFVPCPLFLSPDSGLEVRPHLPLGRGEPSPQRGPNCPMKKHLKSLNPTEATETTPGSQGSVRGKLRGDGDYDLLTPF